MLWRWVRPIARCTLELTIDCHYPCDILNNNVGTLPRCKVIEVQVTGMGGAEAGRDRVHDISMHY